MFIPYLLFYFSGETFPFFLELVHKYLNLNINIPLPDRLSINQGAFWQVVSSMFLHGGLFHIFFNMFALFVAGKKIEQKWGKTDFLTFYLFCGIFANVLSIPIFILFKSPASITGASGAVFGVLLAYATYFPDSKMVLFLMFQVKTKWAILILAGLALYFEINLSGGGISNVTHLLGFVAGFLYIFFIKKINPIQKMFFPDKDEYIIQ